VPPARRHASARTVSQPRPLRAGCISGAGASAAARSARAAARSAGAAARPRRRRGRPGGGARRARAPGRYARAMRCFCFSDGSLTLDARPSARSRRTHCHVTSNCHHSKPCRALRARAGCTVSASARQNRAGAEGN